MSAYKHFIWLDSSTDPKQGRYDILSASPLRWLEFDRGTLRTSEGHSTHATVQHFYQRVAALLEQVDQPQHQHIPFIGGLLGYFGYHLGNQQYDINHGAHSKTANVPDAWVGLYPWAVVVDHHEKQSFLFTLPGYEHTLPADLLNQLLRAQTAPPEKDFTVGQFEGQLGKSAYLKALSKVHDYIQAGDCYQVNFTHRFTAPFRGSPVAAYLHLRQHLPSPFSAYIQLPGAAVLSVSPERLLKVENAQVETRPIKGTMPRGNTPAEDHTNALTLQQSEKDRAENLMIVDLLRNDLSKVCEAFSVKVPELFKLESYTNVHHLVSSVTGKLRDEFSLIDLLEACFPGGSITGAPKKRAMEIIHELENTERSVYCGSIGYFSANGNMDSNIAIRTAVYDGRDIHCWGGGGIVADSNPEQEYAESLNKIRLILQTLSTGHSIKE